MNRATKPKLEAVAAYENAHLVARDLLTAVREMLDNLPRPDGGEQIDWGHVGDVNHVNDLLSQVACFLSGADESDR